MRTLARGGRNWARSNKFLPSWVYREIQTFKTSGPQKPQITFFGEHHLVNGKELVQANDGKPNTARDVLTVGHHEQHILLLSLDAELFESRRLNPGEFAPCVHQNLGNDRGLSAINRILNLASCVNRAHTSYLQRECATSLIILPIAKPESYASESSPSKPQSSDASDAVRLLIRFVRTAREDQIVSQIAGKSGNSR